MVYPDVRPHRIVLLVFLAAPAHGRLRGGKISKRDSWYGLEGRDDFSDFKRWWHRQGKDEAGGNDLQTREEAVEAYDHWVSRGRPCVN